MSRVSVWVVAGAVLVGVTAGGAGFAHATQKKSHKIDCEKVVSELEAGKTSGEVAREMKLKSKQVLSCQKQVKSARAKAAKEGGAAAPTDQGAKAPQ